MAAPSDSQPLASEDEYDVIVVGTSLAESILSAALSVAGARVLHMDENAFYGSHHATISLAETHRLILSSADPAADDSRLEAPSPSPSPQSDADGPELPPDLGVLELSPVELGREVFGVVESYPGGDGGAGDLPKGVTIDLRPRIVLAAGPLVDLLVSTGSGHYLSFRPLDATFLRFAETGGAAGEAESMLLQKVPVSRSDVFQSTFLSMVEKRLLMRFLKASTFLEDGQAVESDDEADSPQSVEDLMDAAKLTSNIRAFLRHAIVFSELRELESVDGAEVSASDCRSSLQTYMKSLIRYGTATPFLYANHGSGEMCEAFCRLSAVHGGTFMLRRRVASVVTNRGEESSSEASVADEAAPGSVRGVVTADGELLRARHVFLRGGMVPHLVSPSEESGAWRYICILDQPVFSAEEPRVLGVFPAGVCGNTGSVVHVLQMNSTAEVCPEGMYVLYAETVGRGGSSVDILNVMTSLLSLPERDSELANDTALPLRVDLEIESEQEAFRPKPLWSVLYQQARRGRATPAVLPAGLAVVCDSAAGIDAQKAIDEAQRCFCSTGRSADDFFVTRPSASHDEEVGLDQP